jgi:hypothetical protein
MGGRFGRDAVGGLPAANVKPDLLGRSGKRNQPEQ